MDPTTQAPTIDAQPLTSPPSIKFKIHKNLSPAHAELLESRRENDDEHHHAEDDQEELMTFVLTEDIFVEILSARLQVLIHTIPFISSLRFYSHSELIASTVSSSTVWTRRFLPIPLKLPSLFSKRSTIVPTSTPSSRTSPIRSIKKLNPEPMKFDVGDHQPIEVQD